MTIENDTLISEATNNWSNRIIKRPIEHPIPIMNISNIRIRHSDNASSSKYL